MFVVRWFLRQAGCPQGSREHIESEASFPEVLVAKPLAPFG